MNTYDVIFDYIEKLPDGLNQARIALQRHLIEARETENLTQADVCCQAYRPLSTGNQPCGTWLWLDSIFFTKISDRHRL